MVDDPSDAPTEGDAAVNTKPHPTIGATDADLVPSVAAMVSLPPPGYALGHVIGRGGMGEVHVAQDRRIGREIAVKRMRNPTPTNEALARFLREARIQAKLDHPAMVPVHELGIDEGGRPYFTMKRVVGMTLARLLADGGTQPRLLRAFIDVCLAIDFAHSRGVVHRDLKPANVMIGDYGEVYILDWGVARVLTDQPEITNEPIEPTPDPEDSTKSGALLGTPGYISPEQIQGAVAAPPADVYALGCILFEILAAEPLHPKGSAAIGRTLSTPQAAPALRRPDRMIPPELDVACFHSLADDPKERPSARELADRVQAYLDGDRDLERRRDLASQQLARAREALESGDPDARATAMRRAGRALALDPESTEAAELVSALLLEPPEKMPPDLVATLAKEEADQVSDRNRNAILGYLSVFMLLPLPFLLDVKNWILLVALFTTIALGAAVSWNNVRQRRTALAPVLVVTISLVILFTRIAGPFVLTPLLICGVLVSVTANRWLAERTWAVVAWTATAVMLPIVLEWLDVLPQTWQIRGTSMLVISDIFETHGRPEEVALVIANLSFTVTVGLLALAISRQRRQAQQALHVQAWHLRQLLPTARRPWRTKLH